MCLLVQVESVAGLAALDEILAVEGVDGVFIGPSDLAADMGYMGDPSGPEVQAAIRDALTRIAASDKAACILALDHDTAARYRDWGAQVIAVGIDVLLLANAARALAARWRDG
jgi:4-hydroxy-2-oxoheptanedioate aldolase